MECGPNGARSTESFSENLSLSARVTTVERRTGQGKAGKQMSTLTQFNNVAQLSLSERPKPCYRFGTHFVALVR